MQRREENFYEIFPPPKKLVELCRRVVCDIFRVFIRLLDFMSFFFFFNFFSWDKRNRSNSCVISFFNYLYIYIYFSFSQNSFVVLGKYNNEPKTKTQVLVHFFLILRNKHKIYYICCCCCWTKQQKRPNFWNLYL